jgi:D-alanyl-D-alanine carboxypeptidase
MKKFILPLAVILILISALTVPALAEPMPAAQPLPAGTASPRDWSKKVGADGSLLPTAIKGDSAILIDAKTGKVLFEKDADEPRYPASTTKIMTCLLALESGKSFSDTVTIGSLPNADFINNSDNIDLKSGEQISFGDLLAGMMVHSGNDAADAIAIYIGGSVDNFVEMMNQRAQQLGMTGTHYTSPNGLADDKNHVTTPRDMAKLVMEAEKNPDFTKLTSKSTYTASPDNMHPSPTAWTTTNYLLLNNQYGYQYATGIKTGYTAMAQSSLVASAEKDGMSLISVDMHVVDRNPNLWTDAVTLFEYGFNYYDTLDVSSLLSSQQLSTDIKNAAGSDPDQGKLSLTLKAQSQEFMTDRKDVISGLKGDPSQFHQQVTVTEDTAPIKKDDKVGTVTFSYKGNPVLTCDLFAARAVDAAKPAPSASLSPTNSASGANSIDPAQTTGGINGAFIWIAIFVLLLALAGLTIRLVNTQRRNRKYSYRQSSGTRMRR